MAFWRPMQTVTAIRLAIIAALAAWQASSPFDRVDGAYHGPAVPPAAAVRR